MEEEYQYDTFIEEPEKTIQEKHKENFQEFLNEWKKAIKFNGEDIWDQDTETISYHYDDKDVQRFDEMIVTDREVLKKTLLILSHLQYEMKELASLAEREFYAPLSIFGAKPIQSEQQKREKQKIMEKFESDEDKLSFAQEQKTEEGMDELSQFGRSLEFLITLWNYKTRSQQLVIHVIQQLHLIHVKGQNDPTMKLLSKVDFFRMFTSIGALLKSMITLDAIILKNNVLSNYFYTRYVKMLTKIIDDPEYYELDGVKAKRLLTILKKIKGEVLDGKMFMTTIQSHFDGSKTGQLPIKNNSNFKKRFLAAIKEYLDMIESKLGKANEGDAIQKVPEFVGLYVLYKEIFTNELDQRLYKSIWNLQKRTGLIHLYGNVSWTVCKFLFEHGGSDVPQLVGIKNPTKDMTQPLVSQYNSLIKSLQSNVDMTYLHLSVWLSQFESSFKMKHSKNKESQTQSYYLHIVQNEGSVILNGINLIHKVNNILRTLLHSFTELNSRIFAEQIPLIFKCIEMLKTISAAFHRKSSSLASNHSAICELASFNAKKLLLNLRKKYATMKRKNENDHDRLAAINLAVDMLSLPPTEKRFVVLELALNISLFNQTVITGNNLENLYSHLSTLRSLMTFDKVIEKETNCGILYWNLDFLANYYQYVHTHPETAPQLKYIFSALEDAGKILKTAIHYDESKVNLCESFKKAVLDQFELEIIKPIEDKIDIELRNRVNLAITQGRKQEINAKEKLMDMNAYFNIRPIRFFDIQIELSNRIARHLDKTFYNHTALSQNNWGVYEEMRTLAKEIYTLNLMPVYLPGQTLGQGLDVIIICRRINEFVNQYSYNMHQNMFVEKKAKSNSKHLDTINVRHVANSIRTHGTGIMNTTVNFVYKHIVRQLFTFSQFLHDDLIKGRLIRDIRFFKENKETLDSQYPLHHAKERLTDLRALGKMQGSTSPLDRFRLLITSIGNALAYIRMVRCGGLRHISNSVKFVPDINNIVDFAKISGNLSDETQRAGSTLSANLTNLADKFSEGSDYFKMMEKNFSEELLKEKYKHVRRFYIMIPALTLSYVESMLSSKEKLKRNLKGANFTDDGFIIGIAFILKVLHQVTAFKSLHWFESVCDQYNKEYEAVQKQISESRKTGNESLNTMHLSADTARRHKEEFELLSFAYSGASIFFE
mmetsp:Transcript_14300/g.21613  ORF Transcript_14300/g.21613 Transcript_14300/m.21613 type:complete len:1166 (+) Transcript_14300:135-3632(+)